MRITVLAVDDVPENLELLELYFAASNPEFKLIKASSGLEALEIIRSITIHALITDWNMPNGDGHFLITEMRSRGHDMPVIIWSGTYKNDLHLLGSLEKISFVSKIQSPREIMEILKANIKL